MSVKVTVLCWGNLVQADNECESLRDVEATLHKLKMSVKVSVLCWGNLVQADNECESHCIMLR